MKAITLLLCGLCLSSSLGHIQNPPRRSDQTLDKLTLLADIKTLAIEIPKLDGPLARALAKAEVADAAWTLDQPWAKESLREAFRLTYLTEEEQRKVGPEAPGSAPRPPTALGRARNDVRKRILSVARRDEAFANQLLAESSTQVTKDDRQMMNAQLALIALDEGNNEAAFRSIQENISIDPTQLIFVQLVNDLAVKDRAGADKLILQCISSLSSLPLADQNLTRARAEIVLRWLVFPNSFFPDPNKIVPTPGPEVMKAYVSFVIESLTAVQRVNPEILKRERSTLLSVWLPLNQYAPELRSRFMELEAISRTPGQDASLPTQSSEEAEAEKRRLKEKEVLNSSEPNEFSINAAIVKEDFELARKLISKLPDGAKKTEFQEQVNTKEALSLAKSGDLVGAQALAERLTRVGSLLQVYPRIIEQHAINKDPASASAAVQQALKQLRTASSKPVSPSAQSFGMPAEFAPTAIEVDGILATLGKLAKALIPIDSLLASEIVDELVKSANESKIDTSQGRTGMDSDLFKTLAAKDEVRARSSAEGFKDRLRRIVALAAIYQWKAQYLEKTTPKKPSKRSAASVYLNHFTEQRSTILTI